MRPPIFVVHVLPPRTAKGQDRHIRLAGDQDPKRPTSSNAVKTDVDVASIDGVAYPINKNETMLSFMRRPIGPNPVPTLCDAPNVNAKSR